MVIDTSAIVAILLAEPEATAFERLISNAPVARISAATLVELGVVVDTFRDPVVVSLLERLLEDAPLIVEPLTETQARNRERCASAVRAVERAPSAAQHGRLHLVRPRARLR